MASYALWLLLGFLAVAVVRLYRAALPKPIPGIPYHRKSARSILGDIPDCLRHYRKTGMLSTFCVQRCEELNSPIFQIFVRPFCKPWVIVSDAREAQDILTRRGREFDRSQFFSDMYRALFPWAQASLPTHDQWRANRRLMADTMSTDFLNNIAAPLVYANTLDLVELWRHKQRLANGAAFPAEDDLMMCTIDTVWAATFDEEIGACKSQTKHLAGMNQLPNSGPVIDMPRAPAPEAFTELRRLFHSMEIPLHSPFGYWHHWFAVNFYPSLRRARAVKDRLVGANIQAAWRKFSDGSADVAQSNPVKSAAELVVEREIALARKEGRPIQRNSGPMHDELTIFLGAGFESVGTTVAWGLKYLARYNEIQDKLRKALETSFTVDDSTGQPMAQSIAKDQCAYLDAFMDEVLRHCCIVSGNSRTTMVDTVVLGHFIPKGVDVQLLCVGPSSTSPALPVDENRRSKSSREAKEGLRRWNQTDLGEFRPERWIVQGESGQDEFDSRAAPMQAFGGGVRGCFGRKLAYVELRNIFTLLVWNFEIQPPPKPGRLDFKGQEVVTHKPQTCDIALGLVQRKS